MMGYFKEVHQLGDDDYLWMGGMVLLSPIVVPIWWMGYLFDTYVDGGD